MDHPRQPIETTLLLRALPLILSTGFVISSATRAFAQDRQDTWSGQAQCQLTVQSPAYFYQEIQTWRITGAPNASGSMVYPATWSVEGKGMRQDAPGTQTIAAQWNTNVPPMSAPLAIFVNSAHQLIFKSYHAQLRADGAVTGSRQISISGVAQRPSPVSFAEFEWQFPTIEVEGTRTDVSGTSSTPLTTSIGPMQPSRLEGVANCQWQFAKGAVTSGAAIPVSQAAMQTGNSPGATAVNTTATSLGVTPSSGPALPAGQRATTSAGGASGATDARTTVTSPGATASSHCQAVERSQDPMVMGTFRAGKSVSHSGTLSSAADSHFFQVKLPAGVDGNFSLSGMQPGSDFDLYVYHSDYSPIACSVTRGTASENIQTQFGHSQNSNVVVIEVRSSAWNASSPAYTLTFKGVADGAAAP